MERLTPLQEKELENASLRQQLRDFQQEIDEVRTKYGDLEAEKASWGNLPEEMKAKDEIIEGLSNELAKQESEINSYNEEIKSYNEGVSSYNEEVDSYNEEVDSYNEEVDSYNEVINSYNEHNIELQDLLRKHYEARATNERHRSEEANARKVMDKEFSSVPLTASEKTEAKDRAKPFQVKQSSSNTLAKELISGKVLTTSIDATDHESEVVKIKNQVSHRTGSKKTFSGQPPINTDCYQYLHTEDFENGGKSLKKAEVLETGSADDRYIIPLPGTTDLSGPPYPQVFSLSTASLSKEETTIVPRSSTPQAPTLPTSPQKLQRSGSVACSADLQRTESVQTHAQLATEPPEELMSNSDEEEQKPDASVQTGFVTANSQTRGKYWPRGVL